MKLVVADFEQMVEKTHLAIKEFYKGNPQPYHQLYSLGSDVSLLGAQGGISVGSNDVSQHLTSRASWFKEGKNVSFQRIVQVFDSGFGLRCRSRAV